MTDKTKRDEFISKYNNLIDFLASSKYYDVEYDKAYLDELKNGDIWCKLVLIRHHILDPKWKKIHVGIITTEKITSGSVYNDNLNFVNKLCDHLHDIHVFFFANWRDIGLYFDEDKTFSADIITREGIEHKIAMLNLLYKEIQIKGYLGDNFSENIDKLLHKHVGEFFESIKIYADEYGPKQFNIKKTKKTFITRYSQFVNGLTYLKHANNKRFDDFICTFALYHDIFH